MDEWIINSKGMRNVVFLVCKIIDFLCQWKTRFVCWRESYHGNRLLTPKFWVILQSAFIRYMTDLYRKRKAEFLTPPPPPHISLKLNLYCKLNLAPLRYVILVLELRGEFKSPVLEIITSFLTTSTKWTVLTLIWGKSLKNTKYIIVKHN